MTIIQKLNNIFPNDEIIDIVKHYIITQTIPDEIENKKRFIQKYKNFIVDNDKLIYKPLNLEVVYKSNIDKILEDEYNKNDVIGKGIKNFYKYIITKYINITRQDIDDFLKTDNNYQMTRQINKRINKPIIAKYPNQIWCIDLIDMSSVSKSNYNYKYIISIIDVFTRKCFLEKIKDKTANNVSIGFNDVCIRAGITPNYIISDNGLEFKGEFSEYCKNNNIKQRFVRAYSPQANGIVERLNQEIRKIIKDISLNNNNIRWTTYLKDVEENKNNTYNETVKASPNEIWTPDKNKDFSVKNTKNKKKLEAQKNIKKQVQKEIKKFKNKDDYDVDDDVRIKMSSIFSNVRKLIKQKNTKQLIINYSPDIFVIHKKIIPRQGTLERNRYVLKNKNTNKIVQTPTGTHKLFYGSELLYVPPATPDDNNITMNRALTLNKIDTNNNDLLYE